MNSVKNFRLENCYKILKKNSIADDCKVESYEFCPFQEKVGFLGDHAYLKIHYIDANKKKTKRFFAKTMCSAESQRDFAIETGAFYKECCMFQEIVPEFIENGVGIIKDCVPNCYAVSNLNYLIFEDLGLKGYTTMSQRESLNLQCVKSCLKTLGKFHGSAMIFEEKMLEKTGESYVFSERFPKLFKETFYSSKECSVNLIEATKKGVQTQIDMFEDPSLLDIKLFKELACATFDQFHEIVKPSTLFRNTICHGDLWAFNVMFKFEDNKPIHSYLVDFQSYRYGPPAQDFLGFMYFSTDRQFRQKHMEEMMNYYYRQMEKTLNQYKISIRKVLPYSEFLESCDYYKTFCIAQAINHFQLIMAPTEEANALFATPEVLRKALFEDKSVIIVKLSEIDSVYKQKMLDSVAELRDNFIERGLLHYY